MGEPTLQAQIDSALDDMLLHKQQARKAEKELARLLILREEALRSEEEE